MTREQEQFEIIKNGIIDCLEDMQLEELKGEYTPLWDNSDVGCDIQADDFSDDDMAEAMEIAKQNFIDKLRQVFPEDNKALIMLEKIVENI